MWRVLVLTHWAHCACDQARPWVHWVLTAGSGSGPSTAPERRRDVPHAGTTRVFNSPRLHPPPARQVHLHRQELGRQEHDAVFGAGGVVVLYVDVGAGARLVGLVQRVAQRLRGDCGDTVRTAPVRYSGRRCGHERDMAAPRMRSVWREPEGGRGSKQPAVGGGGAVAVRVACGE